MRRYGFRAGASVRIGMSDDALGVLGAYSGVARRFDEHDEHFLQAIANVLADAITRRRIEDDMSRRALTDALTGLPNRTLLMDRLAHWREGAMRSGAQAALLFLDLDHFKVINDSLGHDAGDDLLRAVGPRLQGAVRPSDTVARFGGDEFVVLCEDITEEGAEAVAQRILTAFSQPISLQGRSHVVSPSIGVALSGTPPLSADALVRNADAALYRAKGRGRGRAEVFQPGMHRRFVRRMSLERALRTALAGGEGLRVVYQPVVTLDSGAPAGFEALARWTHPIDGEVPPSEFVGVAEESGLIVELGRWVLCEALGQAGAWQAAHPGADGARVSVNLSPRQVSDPRLVDTIAKALADAHTPHGSLSLEVTETVLMDDTDLMLEVMYRLRALGVRLMLDDFGTGYSSLSHVRRFPIAALKLDKTFVDEVRTDPSSRAIVSAVLHLAEGLGADVVAEGVETRGQADAVRELGCPLGQGYLFGRPMEAEQASEMLAAAG
jgi:diguanylate cyclase (GGDEF)-like protein